MCKWSKWGNKRVDPCMRAEIEELNKEGIITLACCCGHNKYPKTMVIKHQGTKQPYEFFSKQYILRKKRFYRRDNKGVYYIPEVLELENKRFK